MQLPFFAMRLTERFSGLPPEEIDSIERDATEWWRMQHPYEPAVVDDQGEIITPAKHNNMLGRLRYYNNQWYVRLILAVLFIFCIKWIGEWMHESNNNNDHRDDNDI